MREEQKPDLSWARVLLLFLGRCSSSSFTAGAGMTRIRFTPLASMDLLADVMWISLEAAAASAIAPVSQTAHAIFYAFQKFVSKKKILYQRGLFNIITDSLPSWSKYHKKSVNLWWYWGLVWKKSFPVWIFFHFKITTEIGYFKF